eukprot:scaffold263_cov120-Isochrysis_galbana.AAC.4
MVSIGRKYRSLTGLARNAGAHAVCKTLAIMHRPRVEAVGARVLRQFRPRSPLQRRIGPLQWREAHRSPRRRNLRVGPAPWRPLRGTLHFRCHQMRAR